MFLWAGAGRVCICKAGAFTCKPLSWIALCQQFISREESIDESARLANAIVVVKDERADPFFDESARSMVRGLILHVLTAADFEKSERTLLMVRDLLMRGEWRIAQVMRDQAGPDDEAPGSTN